MDRPRSMDSLSDGPMEYSCWRPILAVRSVIISSLSSFTRSSTGRFHPRCKSIMFQTIMDALPINTTKIVLYLSYFYKHHELTLRLSWFWGMMTVAEILAALLAYGILHMRDVEGRSGWRWLFLIEVRAILKVRLAIIYLMSASRVS